MTRNKFVDILCCFVWIVLKTYALETKISLCPKGWNRCGFFCHKVVFEIFSSYADSVKLCQKENSAANLAMVYRPSIKDCFTAELKETGLARSLIILTDEEFEGIFPWDSRNDFFFTDLKQPDRTQVKEHFEAHNSRVLNCVEQLQNGDWNLVACIASEPWKAVVCQKHILLGRVCGLNGTRIEL